MTMHEDNRPARGTTHTTPARTTTSTTTTREAEAASDLLVAPAGWRLSWGAVFAGVMVALVAHLILNLLGIGIGLAGAPTGAGLDWFGTGFGVWWAIAGIIAAAIGGWFAGRTLGSGDRNDGMIHGLLSWAGATLVMAFLLTTAMGGVLGVQRMQQQAMGPAAGATGQAGGAPAPGTTAQVPAPGTTATPGVQQPVQPPTAGALSGAAIASFVALLIGAAAAAAAGRSGVSSARRALREEG
ncbi:MAG: hypothetical protein KJZ80_14330 [Hyphomicrobiaceae bacterium]|nr:hypothetical protein [Hyphomicrobiaceae bacterium]